MDMSDRVKLRLTLKVLLMFVIFTASWKQSTSKKTEMGSYVIKNIGIKLCQLKCAEHGQCLSIEYDITTLTCRLLRDDSKIKKKKGDVIPGGSHSHVPTGSSTSGMCSFGQRYLKTRSGKEVCVQASIDPSTNTVPPAPEMTQDSDPNASTTDACDDLTSSKAVPSTPVTTQDIDPHATPSQARGHDLHLASRRGDLERVKRILAAGHVDINTRGMFSRTPVMAAAQKGHRDVVEFLVCRGAEVSLVDVYGETVLHLACEGKDVETVKLILSLNKVDVSTKNKLGKTAADKARDYGRQQVLDLLVSRDAH